MREKGDRPARLGSTDDVIELGMAKARHRKSVITSVDANGESSDVVETRKGS